MVVSEKERASEGRAKDFTEQQKMDLSMQRLWAFAKKNQERAQSSRPDPEHVLRGEPGTGFVDPASCTPVWSDTYLPAKIEEKRMLRPGIMIDSPSRAKMIYVRPRGNAYVNSFASPAAKTREKQLEKPTKPNSITQDKEKRG